MAQHIMVPKEGIAVHINAFNFPVWGMLEKCAVNWLAGVPAVVKPATITCFLTEQVVRYCRFRYFTGRRTAIDLRQRR